MKGPGEEKSLTAPAWGKLTVGLEMNDLIHWHWLVGAPGVMLACWGSVSLQELLGPGRGAEQVVETLVGMENGLPRGLAAQALLEDWVLDLV